MILKLVHPFGTFQHCGKQNNFFHSLKVQKSIIIIKHPSILKTSTLQDILDISHDTSRKSIVLINRMRCGHTSLKASLVRFNTILLHRANTPLATRVKHLITNSGNVRDLKDLVSQIK